MNIILLLIKSATCMMAISAVPEIVEGKGENNIYIVDSIPSKMETVKRIQRVWMVAGMAVRVLPFAIARQERDKSRDRGGGNVEGEVGIL